MTTILLSGYPGRMALEIERLCQSDPWSARFEVLPVALGSGRAATGARRILSPANRHEGIPGAEPGGAIAVDFSTPAAALDNLRFLAGAGFWCVVGTTGFDRDEARRIVESSGTSAVIAPNMAAPIVLAQAALRHLADRFPGSMSGMHLRVTESHQASKRDTSGTAIALAAVLAGLGLTQSGPIESVRDRERQLALGVPEGALHGHGWHWFHAADESGMVELRLETRLCGRRAYAEGALRAAEFLARRRDEGEVGRVYSMEDVLAGG